MSETQVERVRKGGNPAWVPGVSGNPGGKTREWRQLQSDIERLHGPHVMAALERLRDIGMGVVTFGKGRRAGPAHDKCQVLALTSYLDRLGFAPRKPKEGEEDRGLKELSAEEMDELAAELKARAETKRGEVS